MESRNTDQHDPESPRWTQRGLSRRGAKAYQAVLEAVLCVPAGALLGYGVDRWLETGPWGVLVGLGFGFVAFIMSAIRLPGRLAAVSDDEEAEENQDES